MSHLYCPGTGQSHNALICEVRSVVPGWYGSAGWSIVLNTEREFDPDFGMYGRQPIISLALFL